MAGYTEFSEFSLGPEGNEYIRRSLEAGGSLSTHLLECQDLERGRVFTRFPRWVDPSSLRELDVGGKLPIVPGTERYGRSPDGTVHEMTPVPDTNDDLVRFIQDFLRGGESRICLFENWLGAAADPWIAHARSHVLGCGEEVYHVVCAGSANLSAIGDAVREAKTIPVFVGVLSYADRD